jgi:hypothetical protein
VHPSLDLGPLNEEAKQTDDGRSGVNGDGVELVRPGYRVQMVACLGE